MKHYVFIWACLYLLLANFSFAANAQELSDAAIKKLYADNAAAVNDIDKIRQLLKSELDDDFSAQVQTTELADGSPARTELESFTKDQQIDSMIEGLKDLKNLKYEYQVAAIKYSDDHKYAFVSGISKTSGTMSGSRSHGKIIALNMNDTRKCIDKIMLQGTALKIMDSTCTDTTVIKK